MDECAMRSLLWDMVTDREDGDAQSPAIGRLAALLAGQERRIAELEKQCGKGAA